ncbi:membrane integrity lipid transport subunit YebS [Sodalis ligni]|jgi:paraquat-inducible protein A|uniref:Paraquat-inducible protein A n=1 Tax=Sodalis ligni TaxID=2697027 RepID=A0A4R1NCP7_9GAMM|nr:membrane integrity lipid transport subunit YebS [Sodalis ligni]TCL02356.1 paraquat-inducible protein A [Sodalis ligni]
MKIKHIHYALPQGRYQRCAQCDTLFILPTLHQNQDAFCPRCRAKVAHGHEWTINQLAILALTMVVLMPFAYGEPLISIRLLGTSINATLVHGIWQMAIQGQPITASMVAFCTVGAPCTLVIAILYLNVGERLGMNLRPVLLMLTRLKEWVMLDIYLIGMAVAAIKVKDYADVDTGLALPAFIALALLSVVTMTHLNIGQLWEHFYPEPAPPFRTNTAGLKVCLGCNFTGYADERGRCPRCHTPLRLRRRQSLQKSWAALIASVVLLIPANLLPISIIYINGSRNESTILSAIGSLANDNIPVAAVVFIASILVPFIKVIVLLTLLLSIHFKVRQGLKTRIRLLRFVSWIGRWSMLDLFVISITMSLVDRDQLLAFTMGPAAFYFGSAVILTILAVEWLDSRLIWDAHAANADYTD